MSGGFKLRSVILALLLCAAAFLFWQGYQLREENRTLLAQVANVQKLSAEDPHSSALHRLEAQVETLHNANKDLFKLRNEMAQLRRQKAELDRLRIENAELGARLKGRSVSPGQDAVASGFVARNAFVDLGFATPEAAVQTFFKSLVTEDYPRFNQCLVEAWEVEPFDLNSVDAYRFRETVALWKKFPGYFLGDSKTIDANTIELQIKTSAHGASMPLKLERINNEWKISDRNVKRE